MKAKSWWGAEERVHAETRRRGENLQAFRQDLRDEQDWDRLAPHITATPVRSRLFPLVPSPQHYIKELFIFGKILFVLFFIAVKSFD